MTALEEPGDSYQCGCQREALQWIVTGGALVSRELGFPSPALGQDGVERCPCERVRTRDQEQQLQVVPGGQVRGLMCNHLPKLIPSARGDDAFRCHSRRAPAADNADDRFRDIHDLDNAPALDEAALSGATRLQEGASRRPGTPAPPDSMSQSEQSKRRQSQ